ncbi:MAG: serine protease [Anaerolineaceae bacterium]|nr:serine protease [Anaerolineaceae bacterium]
MSEKKNPSRFILILSVLVLTILACGTSGAGSSDLNITVSPPPGTLEVGGIFQVKLTLLNQGEYNLDISEIRLPDILLNGATLINTDPIMTLGSSSGGQTSFNYAVTIAPSGQEDVTFTFEAAQPGDFAGTGGVVSNAGTTKFQTRILVEGSVVAGWTPGPSGNKTPIPLGEIPYQAVVQISALVDVDGRQLIGWTGSGTIITTDGLILTNAHVVLSDRFYTVKDLIISMTVAQDSLPVETYLASIIQADANLDIAVIKIRADINNNPINTSELNLPAVPLGDSDTLQLGDPITIIGYPGIGGATITLTKGEVSGFTAESAYGNRAFVKTSATIAGGNSGGLAANAVGEIIGIPTQVGSGNLEGSIVDCRPLADTNRDGYIDDDDSCVPTGGFINALRPIKLAMAMINLAKQGQVAVEAGSSTGETYTPSGDVDFYDDFSNPNSGWYTATDDSGSTAYSGGEFVIQVFEPDWVIWSNIDNRLDNIILTVDARVISGVGDGDFGFVCGLIDSNNFTVIDISEDGYFSMWKYANDQYISLVDWTYADEIAAGGPYSLAAFCGTDHLALAVNGNLLISIVDPDFRVGDVGLLAGVFETPGIKIGYDNFQLITQ